MKKVILTNSTVVPFYKSKPNDPDEVLRIIKPNDSSTFKSTLVSFNIETKALDSAESKARLFEKCTIYIKNDDQLENLKSIIKNGAILELEGYEKRTKSEKDNKYYTSIIVRTMTPISTGTENSIEDSNIYDTDELPF